jgi:RNA polymerase sigma-70 factor (ECF subfamily)
MEDARQEILLGICSDLGRFRFQSGFKTFFYRYARNKAVDLLRRTVRRHKRETGCPVVEADSSGNSPEEDYVKRETATRLADKLLELSPRDRELLLLKEVEGFSVEEINRLTGLKTGTVKSSLHRAREKLFRLMEGGAT